MKFSGFSKLVGIALLVLGGQAFSAPVTEFHYTSSPTSWVGHGETVTITPTTGFGFSFNPSRNFDRGVSFAINDFVFNPDFWSERWWYLDFAAPMNEPLHVGHYASATRFPFQDSTSPGLSFTGNGRGDNQLTGYFDVLGVTYDNTTGALLSFAADFTQYDENNTDWWNRGSIRFNYEPLLAVPEPSLLSLLGVGLLGIVAVRRRKEKSRPTAQSNLTS